LRDGAPAGSSRLTVSLLIGAFWVGGVGLVRFAAAKPCLFVTLDSSDDIGVTWRYPFKAVRRKFPKSSVTSARVVESLDSDGDPYFYARVFTADQQSFDIREGHSRETCTQACEQFCDILRGDANKQQV